MDTDSAARAEPLDTGWASDAPISDAGLTGGTVEMCLAERLRTSARPKGKEQRQEKHALGEERSGSLSARIR